MIYFTAHTFKCVCHCRRAMFRVLGMYNFDLSVTLVFLSEMDFNLISYFFPKLKKGADNICAQF